MAAIRPIGRDGPAVWFPRSATPGGGRLGGYVVHNGEQRFIRGLALLRNIPDLESIVVRREANGTPLLIRDVASVTVAPLTRQGAATRDGRGEAVIGMVMMSYGENSRQVVDRAKARLDEIRGTLPEGVNSSDAVEAKVKVAGDAVQGTAISGNTVTATTSPPLQCSATVDP